MAGGEGYEFGDFRLDASERLLSREGHAIPLSPKTYDVLLALVRGAGRLSTKRELLDLVWPETSVEEGILAVHISTLRKTLGDDKGKSGYIETVSRTGYRFVAPVRRLAEAESLPAPQSIAVLPARPFFGNIFSEWDHHIGLAIADVLTDCLGRFPRILVRPIRTV